MNVSALVKKLKAFDLKLVSRACPGLTLVSLTPTPTPTFPWLQGLGHPGILAGLSCPGGGSREVCRHLPDKGHLS